MGGDPVGRRALRKARTRAEVRATAQRLFAERGFDVVTIADVATAADVAVQTVFNHFDSKEALFFDGHTSWVDGPARAVRERAPGTSPLTALRTFFEKDVTAYLTQLGAAEERRHLETLSRSTTLVMRERELMVQSGYQLTEVLLDALQPAEGTDPALVRMVGALTSGLFLAAVRVLVMEHRAAILAGSSALERATAMRQAVAVTFATVEQGVRSLAEQLGVSPDGPLA